MSTVIRRAGPGDVAVVAEFNRRLAEETEDKVLDLATLTAGVAAGIADPAKALYFVAEDGGQVVGMTMVTFEWSDWRNGWFWWIQSVYVRKESRRRGVFRALYEHIARAAAAASGVIGLRLYVERDNAAAQQTYQGLGLQPTTYLVLERCPLG